MPADNEWFHASWGVCPQTVLWKFANTSPARTFVEAYACVKPPTTLYVSRAKVRSRKTCKIENCGCRQKKIL